MGSSIKKEENFGKKLWKNQQQQCDVCHCSGQTHFRVTSDKQTSWLFVCPSCWPTLVQEEGYRYGGTRQANRRQRKSSSKP
jgi:transcription initiation factor IIE alpha subunit